MDANHSNSGRPPRRPVVPGRSHVFVETEVFRRVREAVRVGDTPALILGPGGSGKTSLLAALADEWASSGRKVVFLSLYEFGRGEDILLLLRRRLAEMSLLPHFDEGDVITGSSRADLRATVDLIEAAQSDLLIVLDGLDAMAASLPIVQLLEQIVTRRSRQTRLVVSSRDPRGVTSRLFRSVFEVDRFTASEVSEFVHLSGSPELDQATIQYLTATSDGHPLSIALLLGLIRKQGVILDLGFTKLHDVRVMRIVKRALDDFGRDSSGENVKALTSLAILKRPVHGFEYPASVLSHLQKSGLLTTSDSGISIIHPLVAEAILSATNLMTDSAGHMLSTLKFGAEEAELDPLLADSFIALPEFSDVLAGKKSIVVGDRGTGKSAMFAHLSVPDDRDPVGKKPLVKPLTHPAEMLRRLEANGSQLSTADQFRAAWLTLVAYCIADHVKTFSSTEHARAALYLKEMLANESQTGGMLLKFFKGIAERFINSSVKIKLGPVEIEPAGKAGAKGASSIELRAFIKDAATSLAAAGQIALIPLDRIDEIHKYDREMQQKAVQGLFLAEGDLAQLSGIRLIIFLRSDLFKIYDIQEKNKLVSRSMSISWTKPQLLRFLVDRILSNSSLHRLKELIGSIPDHNHEVAMAALFPIEIEGMAAAEWLWEWMENGNGDVSPRQLVLLLILAAQSPVAQEATMGQLPIFPAAALQWGMDQLSELSFKELVDDFRVAPTFLANCRAGRVRSFELANVETLFSRGEGSISVQVERLERLGFLERVVLQNPDGTKTSQFEVPKLFTRRWGVA